MTGAGDRIASLARLVIVFRLLALNATIAELVTEPDRAPLASLAICVLALVLFAQLRLWSRGPDERALVRNPLALIADALLTMGLFFFFGPESPYFLSTIGLTLAAGAVHGRTGAIVSSVALAAAYFAVLLTGGDDGTGLYFPTYVTLPLLYPASAAGAAAVRRLLEEQASTTQALRSAELAAVAGEERTRVAREMHDSLGKTLYGIALQASGLARRVQAEAPGAADASRTLSGAAQRAAAEAREIIADLRSDALDLPLADALALHVESWSQSSGVTACVAGDPVDLPHPGTRYELFSIVKEALRNVERHAKAQSVEVRLSQEGDEVVVCVADDGVGLGASGRAADLETDGHWGLVGMSERAERIGAVVRIDSLPGSGTRVEVRLPAGDVRTPEPWAVPARAEVTA